MTSHHGAIEVGLGTGPTDTDGLLLPCPAPRGGSMHMQRLTTEVLIVREPAAAAARRRSSVTDAFLAVLSIMFLLIRQQVGGQVGQRGAPQQRRSRRARTPAYKTASSEGVPRPRTRILVNGHSCEQLGRSLQHVTVVGHQRGAGATKGAEWGGLCTVHAGCESPRSES